MGNCVIIHCVYNSYLNDFSEFSGPVNVSDKELTADGPLEEKIAVEVLGSYILILLSKHMTS